MWGKKGTPAAGKITDCSKYCAPTTNGPTISFSSFRQSFTSNVNYLKRRFSSGDLSSECEDGEAPVDPYAKQPPVTSQPQAPPPPPPPQAPPNTGNSGDLSLNLRPGSKTTSAPSSPAKSRESLLQRVQSLTGQARDQGASILGAAVSSASRVTSSVTSTRYLTLLVIDDQNTDWSKYFRGRRIGEYDIRVEQAEFKEITVTATAESANVSMAVFRGGTRVGRSFRPDFLLIRQNLKDAGEDHKRLLLALKFGGVPSINNLNAIYNFQDKPWVFGHLVQLQRRLGKEAFPLIEQTFYPDHKEMELTHYKTKTLVKTNEGAYDLIPFNNAGIKVTELVYPDGHFPSMLIIEDWLEIVEDHFTKYPYSTLAVHCRCGLGRSAVLVAIALMESGIPPITAAEMIMSKRQGAFNRNQFQRIYEYQSGNRLLKQIKANESNNTENKKERFIFKR